MVQPESSLDLYVLIFGGGLALALLVVSIVGFLLVYQRRVSEQELRVKKLELTMQRAITHRALDAVEEERKRVARDLHDEIGASLSAMRLLVAQLPPAPDTKELTTHMKEVIDDTIDSVRRISSDLLPQGLDELGLTYALEGLCEKTMNVADVEIELTVDTEPQLPNRANLIVYRLVQELLNNALKHAEATLIGLTLRHETDQLLLLHYSDDGRGFDFEQAYQQRSLGLKNIETRARMLNGKVSFATRPGEGVQVSIRIPLTT